MLLWSATQAPTSESLLRELRAVPPAACKAVLDKLEICTSLAQSLPEARVSAMLALLLASVVQDETDAHASLERPITDYEIVHALQHSHCVTCNHLLYEHTGPGDVCGVLACACKGWTGEKH